MCDCFHVVLPTWPGAPGSVSGRQLQPQEPEAETEEDYSVTEGPVEEIIRPRPQGSSPVYECTAEGAGFGAQEHTLGRRSSSGRRRSWWKRDSGDATAFSSMSHPESVQGATEVTLKTEVEAGASGYSVTGGGDQGIFVKQVLKNSSAAKLFSLREGDQLLSATIFFDHMKYEDALKILQYSEPYKVQFEIKRKLPAREEEWAIQHLQEGSKGQEKQDKDVADGYMETPTKTLEADGDRERLISQPREGRGRRPQDRLSWPKFQSIKTKRRLGPRRSRSSSEASEHRDGLYLSSTNTDTEGQLPTESQKHREGSGSRRRKFLNLRFGMGSGQGQITTRFTGIEAQRKDAPAGVLEDLHTEEDKSQDQDTEMAGGARKTDRSLTPGLMTMQMPVDPSQTKHGKGAGEVVGRVERDQRKPRQVEKQETERTLGHSTAEAAEMSWDDQWEAVESLEIGIAKLSLRDNPEQNGREVPGVDLETKKIAVDGEKMIKNQVDNGKETLKERGQRCTGEEERPNTHEYGETRREEIQHGDKEDEERRDGWEREMKHKEGVQEQEKERQTGQGKAKRPKFKIPTFGWSPSKEVDARVITEKKVKETETEEEDKCEARNEQIKIYNKTLDDEEKETQQREWEVMGMTKKMSTGGHLSECQHDVETKETKIKMPKYKMPSFGVSAPGKTIEASLEVSAPRLEADLALPSVQGDLKTPDVSIQLPSMDMEGKAGHLGVKLPEGQMPEGELPGLASLGTGLKGHLTTVHMPGLKMPRVDLKGPQVDLKGAKVDVKGPKADMSAPELEAALPGLEVHIQTPASHLDGEQGLAEKDSAAAKDSKFKMPKFKMPSFGVSAPGKTIEGSLEVSAPRLEADVTLPSVQGELKTTDESIQLPSADLDRKAGQLSVKMTKGKMPEGQWPAPGATGAGLKGHLPTVHMPGLKMPPVDLKRPQVDLKDAKVDVKGPKAEVSAPELEVALPGLKVDIRAPAVRLDGDQGLAKKDAAAAKDSKFKMPKFKMPSFGVSAPGKTIEASLEVSVPRLESDVALPSVQGDLKTPDVSIQLPSVDLEGKAGNLSVKLPERQMPEGELPGLAAAGARLKGHLPTVQMPGLKMPRVDLKGPQVDLKGAKVDVKGPKAEVSAPELEAALPGLEVDIRDPAVRLDGDHDVAEKHAAAAKDSKFKMPKFKMPSFGVSAPGKSIEASLEVSAPRLESDVALPSVQGDLKTPDVSIQLPSTDLEGKAGHLRVKLTEGELPEGEVPGLAAPETGLKGQLLTVQMPILKMPRVDLKGPQVDLKGPKVDVKAPKAEVSALDLDAAPPALEVDLQAPAARLQGDLGLAEKNAAAARDSKFKMPKFKMPSFVVSAPGKTIEASLEGSAPRLEADVALPSVQGDLKTPDVSIQLPSMDLEGKAGHLQVKLPEGQMPEGELPGLAAPGAGLKGHLPTVQMPGLKMPRVDLKGPQVDLKGAKVDVKGPKAEVSAPELEAALPGLEVDIRAPAVQLDGDQGVADKDAASAKDSKFKMPKFKMPSFGVSAPDKTIEASLEVSAPRLESDVALPSVQGDLKTRDVSIQLPSMDLEGKAGHLHVKLPEGQMPEGELPGLAAPGAGLKGHLPTVQMPSLKMPRVDLKGPQVDLKGAKVDVKGPKAEVSAPELEAALPGLEVDIRDPAVRLDGDHDVAEKHAAAAKDSKFKMPKFKMPSFGVSAPGKTIEDSLEVAAPRLEADVALPSVQGDLKTPDVSIQLPSTDLEGKAGHLRVKLTEGELTEGEVPGLAAPETGLKGQLLTVQMPGLKMPRVDLKGPQVDLKGAKVHVKGPKAEVRAPDVEAALPGLEVHIQTPASHLDGEQGLAERDAEAAKHSKFKMPKFKMPSFGVTAPGKTIEASLEVSAPRLEADVALPSVKGDLKTPDVSIQLPSMDLEGKAGHLDVKLPEEQMPEGELPGLAAAGAGLKGHLPTVQMPGLKMPRVDLKGPQVDLKGAKVDVKAPKAEVSTSELEAALPGLEVDIQAPAVQLYGDQGVADKDAASAKDSKFKMPKFKMPSFGVSAPGKTIEASLEVSVPRLESDVALPSVQGDLKTPDVSIQLPSVDLEGKAGNLSVKLPERQMPEGELPGLAAAGARLKGHLPTVQMPGLKMPRVDLKGPQVDLKGAKVDVKGPKAEVSAPELEAALPGLEVDIRDPAVRLDGDHDVAEKHAAAAKDSKFKMPKFKMPSFGVSAPGKTIEASLEVAAPRLEAVVALPSVQGDLKTPDVSIQLPSTDLEGKAGHLRVKLTEGELTEGEVPGLAAPETGLKGQLLTVQMPGLKMPRVDLKGPQVDLKGAKVHVKGPKAEVRAPDVEAALPGLEVHIQTPASHLDGEQGLAERDAEAAKHSKFKMPKFKMPSFGVTAPGKTIEASLEVSAPRLEADVALPSVKGDLKTPDVSIQLPSMDLEGKAGHLDVKLPEEQMPEGELPGLAAAGAGLKGHLPTVQMPGLKMPRVDLKGPQVDLKGAKVDVKAPKAEVSTSELEAALPGLEVDIQAPAVQLYGDQGVADKDAASAKDSKFKMPKFKMPSFGVSAPGKTIEASLEVSVPRLESDVALPSVQGDLKTPDVSIQLPSVDLEGKAGNLSVKLPERQMPEGELPGLAAAGARLKGHLPTVQMPGLKMPRVDLKGPQVDLKGAKVDVKGPKAEVSAPELEAALPGLEVDIRDPAVRLDGDHDVAEKHAAAAKDSKFKMPKFKMPSFGVSAPGKSIEASLEVSAPRLESDVALPSVQGDLKTPDVSIQLPSTDLEGKAGHLRVKLTEGELPEGEVPGLAAPETGLKGQLLTVQMPILKMPRVDLKGPQVDLKGPKVDVKAPKAEVSALDLDAAPPALEVDLRAPAARLQGDLGLAEKDAAAARDSKFKMPKFKMPSFVVSAPGKTIEASLEGSAPRLEADVALPSVKGDLKTPDVSIQLPSMDLEGKAGHLGVKLPEGQMPEGELPGLAAAGAGLKGHLPTVQMPGLKMPRVDLKCPHVDLKGAKVDVKGPKAEVSAPELEAALPGLEVDIRAPAVQLDGDQGVADKDAASAKDSKFRMPKFKMPSFGVSAPGKTIEASLEVSAPRLEADVALPSVQGDLKTPDVSIQLPSTDLEGKAGHLRVKVTEGQMPEGELPGLASPGAGLKGHLYMVQPSLKMRGVALSVPQVSPSVGNVCLSSFGDSSSIHVDVCVPSAVSLTSASFLSPISSVTSFSESLSDSDSSILPSFHAQLMFPKFYKPKFVYSLPPSSVCGFDPQGSDPALPLSALSSEPVLDSVESEVSSSGAPRSHVLDEFVCQSLVVSPSEGSTSEGKSSPFKMPQIKLPPPFTRSPKKEADPIVGSASLSADPIPGLAMSTSGISSELGPCVSPPEAHQRVSTEKESEKGRSRKPSFSLPRLALPKVKASKGKIGFRQGDINASLPGAAAGGILVVSQTAISDSSVGASGPKDVCTGELMSTQLPQASIPPSKLGVRSFLTPGEEIQSKTEVPPKYDLTVGEDSQGGGFGGLSSIQSCGELTEVTDDPLQPSVGQGDNTLTMECPEEDSTVRAMPADSHEGWFRMPKFRLPGFRRSSSKEQDEAGDEEDAHTLMPVASTALEVEAAVTAGTQLSHDPRSEVEAHVSLVFPKDGANLKLPGNPTYADVVRRDLQGTGSRQHHPTAGMSQTYLPTSEFRTLTAAGSLPLERSGVRLSESQVPLNGRSEQPQPGPGGLHLGEVEDRAGTQPSQPEGPLRLKASCTDVPSQVSMVNTSQLWEDSVLTVTFPKLKVPRFSFPGPSSDADVFFPVVREVKCAEVITDSSLHKDGPGLWGASLLKTDTEDPSGHPVSFGQSLQVFPISKARVHIQGDQGKSQEVTIRSRVAQDGADPEVPGAFSTQIIRESEIPASTTQTPSYGFSLLKVKIPEPPVQTRVCTVAQDPWTQEGLDRVPIPASAGVDPALGDIHPDTGEPFEMVSASICLPQLPFTLEEASGPQPAGGASDEEPAEILEFPEDSQEVNTSDLGAKEKTEGKKSSLLWSWLPSIGFSSVEEPSADSRDTAKKSDPIHTQPAARLDPELPMKQERAGWFRFPKLGFSSSPTKRSRSTRGQEGQAEHKLQEETVTFFDARESFSPEEEEQEVEEKGEPGPGSRAMVTSSARTELILLEQDRNTGDKSAPRPVTK